MPTILGIAGILGLVAALGAAWDRLTKRRGRTSGPSDAERARARRKLDYYGKVWDSSNQ